MAWSASCQGAEKNVSYFTHTFAVPSDSSADNSASLDPELGQGEGDEENTSAIYEHVLLSIGWGY